MMAPDLDHDFVKALPKAELHAHLSGSISRETLHNTWITKRSTGQCLDLEDPLIAIQPGAEFVDVVSFFPLFDKYIYALIDDVGTVKLATKSVIEAFAADGVAYLELRTTPRGNPAAGLTKDSYVAAVHDVICEHNASRADSVDDSEIVPGVDVRLILSIDRKMSTEQAEEVVDLALKYKYIKTEEAVGAQSNGTVDHSNQTFQGGYVVAVDLCGNPARGNVSSFTSAFKRAKAHGLGITVHFAEVLQSSTDAELETLLSWQPDRLGHVINVPDKAKQIIKERRLGLELCLSCNVLAKLTTGGFAVHHFGEWRNAECPIALSTDDVGIFGSSLSNEYLLAAQHFDLRSEELIELSRSAAVTAFSGKERMLELISRFAQSLSTLTT